MVILPDGDYCVYSGTPKVPDIEVSLGDSIIDPSAYEVSYNNTNGGEGNNINAGTVIMTITAKEGSGYFGSCNTRFTINPKDLYITANDQTISYGEYYSSSIDQVTAVGLCDGDNISDIHVSANTSDVPGGKIAPWNAKIKNTNGDDVTQNYIIQYQAGQLTVNRAVISIAWEDTTQTRIYTGTTVEITAPIVTNANGTVMNLSPSYCYAYQGDTAFTTGLPIYDGTYTVKASIFESSHYTRAETEIPLTLIILPSEED